jgi:hypothetical protein
MPISSPSRAVHRRLATCLLAALFAASAPSQTLAHPGWDGNNLGNDPWWQHAVFYEVSTPAQADFKAIANTLDALRALGIDALLLPAPALPTAAASSPEDPALTDLDELVHQASLRGMRVLLNLPADTSDPSAAARFWLTRGIAGIHIATAPQTGTQIVPDLRKITGSIAGQRILLSDFDPAAPFAVPTQHRAVGRRGDRQSDPTSALLQIDSRISLLPSLEAATLRPLLTQTLTQPNILLDFHPPTPSPDSALAKSIATILLTLHTSAVINADANLVLPPNAEPITPEPPTPQPPTPAPPPKPATDSEAYVPYVPPPRPTAKPAPTPAPQTPLSDPLTDWYRQLSELHHANAVLRFGSTTLIDFDQQNALVWAIRPARPSILTPPIVVACNLSAEPVQLSIGPALKKLDLHGTYLRTVLRSDKSIGPQDLNNVILPPYSVYIGELHR